jgi:hypothetical protein
VVLDGLEDEARHRQAVPVVRVGPSGCVVLVLVIALVARHVGVKDRLRVMRVARGIVPGRVKMGMGRRDETREKRERRHARSEPPRHDVRIIATCPGLVKARARTFELESSDWV